MFSAHGPDRGYPPIWLRWAGQQVRTAVAYELAAADPGRGPHLRRLPLLIDPRHGDAAAFLRRLIHRQAQLHPDDRQAPQVDPAQETDDGHECFDPEQLAAEIVASGVVAPAWTRREMKVRYRELVASGASANYRAVPRGRTTQPAAPGQLLLPYPA